jgi:threonine aldolase
VIDLRSDTVTLPTQRMREAMATAELGDETYGEDPTVVELERRVCELLGFEAALLTISATMANLVALMAHCRPGDEVFLDRDVHLLRAEAAGVSAIAGVMPTVVPTTDGHPTVDGIRSALHPVDVLTARPRLVWLENTHNRAGGTMMPPAAVEGVVVAARDAGLSVHVDGARVFNAAAAARTRPDVIVAGVDSVTIDFSKGLSCPLGAMVLGSVAFVDRARVARRRLGGGMRQAGVIAAAALVALDETLPRLADDHATAKLLATSLVEWSAELVDPATVATNIVNVRVAGLGGSALVARSLAEAGVRVSQRPPNVIRLVTHRHITADLAREASSRIVGVLSILASEDDRRAPPR